MIDSEVASNMVSLVRFVVLIWADIPIASNMTFAAISSCLVMHILGPKSRSVRTNNKTNPALKVAQRLVPDEGFFQVYGLAIFDSVLVFVMAMMQVSCLFGMFLLSDGAEFSIVAYIPLPRILWLIMNGLEFFVSSPDLLVTLQHSSMDFWLSFFSGVIP